MDEGLRLSPHVQSVIDDDGAILLDVREGRYYSLNSLGAEVWQRLEAGRTLIEVEGELRQKYEEHASRVAADVQRFISELVRTGLVYAGDK